MLPPPTVPIGFAPSFFMSIFERDDAGVDPDVEMMVARTTVSCFSNAERISE
jgi:hypothetical protein